LKQSKLGNKMKKIGTNYKESNSDNESVYESDQENQAEM
jgi:hypothetical protein